jgi:HEAT repeat protein
MLAKVEVAGSGDELIQRLRREENSELRALAVAALLRQAPRQQKTITALARALKDEEPRVAREAIGALAGWKPEDGVLPVLIGALDHADTSVRHAAEDALRKQEFGRSHVPLLAGLLASTRPAVRNQALDFLAPLGAEAAPAVPALGRLLRTAGTEERRKVLALLGEMGPAAGKAGPDLVGLLEDRALGLAVCQVLVKSGAPEVEKALPVLIKELRPANLEDVDKGEAQDRRRHIRQLLIQTGKVSGGALARALTETFEGGNVRTPDGILRGMARLEVLKVVIEMGPPARTNSLMLALVQLEKSDPIPAVRQAAQQARRKLQEKD